MKKKICLLLFGLLISIWLMACESQNENVDTQIEEIEEVNVIEVIKETLIGEWKNVSNGDTFLFKEDGTGMHGEISITYKIENESIAIVEGLTSLEETIYMLDMSNEEMFKLYPEDKSTYYVTPENYEMISEQIKAENLKVLLSYEYWSNNQGLNYVMFTEAGGWFLLSGTTLPLNWEWQDNDTIKLSTTYDGTTYSNIVTLVYENGEYRLIDDMGEVAYVPKNPKVVEEKTESSIIKGSPVGNWKTEDDRVSFKFNTDGTAIATSVALSDGKVVGTFDYNYTWSQDPDSGVITTIYDVDNTTSEFEIKEDNGNEILTNGKVVYYRTE